MTRKTLAQERAEMQTYRLSGRCIPFAVLAGGSRGSGWRVRPPPGLSKGSNFASLSLACLCHTSTVSEGSLLGSAR